MSHKIIKSSQIVEEDFGVIKVKQLLNQVDIGNISLAIVKISGVNKKIINKGSDSIYYVLEGNGAFTINGETIAVEKGDVVFIPKGSTYFDKGTMTLLSFNTPRLEIGTIESLD